LEDTDPMEAEMTIRSLATMHRPLVLRASIWRTLAFAAGLGLGTLSCAVHAAPAGGGDTVRGLYDALLNTMKNGRTLGQSGRFAKLDPVIRRSFDIAEMARLSLGRSWAGLSEAQRQH
jgi:ABC-type transporter MlaC component